VATPALWSCLGSPLEQGLREIWRALGLSRKNLPGRIVSLHWGRIAVNAHAWERLRSRLLGVPPDPALVRPVAGPLEALAAQLERRRARLLRARLARTLEQTRGLVARELDRARKVDLAQSDLSDLAKGPLDERAWVGIVSPWMVERLKGRGEDRGPGSGASRVRAALDLEQGFAAEAGRRLVERAAIERAADVVYLTAEERMRAAHGDATLLRARIEERRERLDRYLEVEIPARFWGRPRVEPAEKR
ncbi:MAG: hypothetical protein ACE5IL_15895, partial [Myxococcota bacterium]